MSWDTVMMMNQMSTQVLVVDDNAADRNLIRLSLLESSHSYKLQCAERLSEGLDKLGTQRTDIVLLDLNLPDSQGNDTVRTVKHRAPDVPILVLTGSDDDRMALEAMRSGAQDYIVKGKIDGHALSRALRHAIERHLVWTASRENPPKQLELKTELLSPALRDASLPTACIQQFGDVMFDGAAGPLTRDHDRGFGKCVVKYRQGYEGFVIEARVHELVDGGFAVEFSIEEHDRGGITQKLFYVPNRFDAQDVAIETAIHAGRQRVNEDLWARASKALNS